jgi:hypothetical protein
MHQQARLVAAFPAVAKAAGELISIEDLESFYSTSKAANAALKFVCENTSCAVPVFAVITTTSKQYRKSSPTSYFRAGASQKHKCEKLAEVTVHEGSTSGGAISASPHRTSAPIKWIDPRTASDGIGGGNIEANGDPEGNGSGSGRQTNARGDGTSQGSSQRVEMFAKAWQAKTDYERKSTGLSAPWNQGGTFDSAFHTIRLWPNVRDAPQCIFVAIVRTVVVYGTGYTIELVHSSSDGLALSLWIPDSCLAYGTAGHALRQQIVAASKSSALIAGHEVFALGTFAEKRIKGSAILSLTVDHPQMMWIA